MLPARSMAVTLMTRWSRAGGQWLYVEYSKRYVEEKNLARENRQGMWSGAFIAPWNWRHRDRNTEILASSSVPLNAQRDLLPARDAQPPVTGCAIKGNINRKGERIYHLRGMRSYAKTKIDEGNGERWFCAEAEARAHGWRKSGE